MDTSPSDSLTRRVRSAIAEGPDQGRGRFDGLEKPVKEMRRIMVKRYQPLANLERRTSGTSDNCARHRLRIVHRLYMDCISREGRIKKVEKNGKDGKKCTLR